MSCSCFSFLQCVSVFRCWEQNTDMNIWWIIRAPILLGVVVIFCNIHFSFLILFLFKFSTNVIPRKLQMHDRHLAFPLDCIMFLSNCTPCNIKTSSFIYEVRKVGCASDLTSGTHVRPPRVLGQTNTIIMHFVQIVCFVRISSERLCCSNRSCRQTSWHFPCINRPAKWPVSRRNSCVRVCL